MTQRRLFGTDGVRGVANQWPMTPEVALLLGQAAAVSFRDPVRRPKIIIGKDTRLSGYLIEQALAAGICSMGADVYLVGPLPTPGIAFLTVSMRADAGIMISGSHNSFEDNGIKFFSRNGFKLPDEVEEAMEKLIANQSLTESRVQGKKIGRAYRIADAVGRYIVFVKGTFPSNLTLEGLRIVLDCAHGAAYKVAPAIFEELGAEVVTIGAKPNGENINFNCGSLHPEAMRQKVLEARADLGIALDGDADRIVFCDDKGELIDGDRIICTAALLMKRDQLLKGQAVVGTIMSNMGLELALGAQGIGLIRTQVGDRYVYDAMRSSGCNLGGEPSGHVIFLDHATTGDGLLTAIQVLGYMQKESKSLRDLCDTMENLPQHLTSVKVKTKPDLLSLRQVAGAVGKAHQELKNQGRVVLRYSGTEPVARVMVEGRDDERVRVLAEEIADAVRKEIGI